MGLVGEKSAPAQQAPMAPAGYLEGVHVRASRRLGRGQRMAQQRGGVRIAASNRRASI